jgi:glycosyltransferase involved in cell wall biosynthesis
VKIAFVGIKRDYSKLDPEYVNSFNKYHLEMPWYYAELGGNDVVVTTTNYWGDTTVFPSGGRFQNITEKDFFDRKFDVVVHWRSWFPEFYQKESRNFMHTCDHSYSLEWRQSVQDAYYSKKLLGIFCHEGWHRDQLSHELSFSLQSFLTGFMQGVDTEIFKPSEHKSPHQMLWASDLGRGFDGALELAINLWSRDKRFELNACHPDYTPQRWMYHPAVKFKGFMKNGPELWNLFNTAGIFPYTSTFPEPSSRAYRQAQAAGCMVLYPPNMGSPSGYIRNGVDGIVAPVSEWKDIILRNVDSGEWREIGKRAREFALSENWDVQTKRFNKLMENYK